MLNKLKAWIWKYLKQCKKEQEPDEWDNWYPDNNPF